VLVGDSSDHDVENLLIHTVVGGSIGLGLGFGCSVVEFESPWLDADPASRSQYANTKTRDHSRAIFRTVHAGRDTNSPAVLEAVVAAVAVTTVRLVFVTAPNPVLTPCVEVCTATFACPNGIPAWEQ